MTTEQTACWIFLATAVASENDAAEVASISSAADMINHAVPTQEELQTSLAWLTEKGIILQEGNAYRLTPKGKADYKQASKKTTRMSRIWENLENIVKKYNT
ncbi:MAG TPA: hypothetical protein VGK59_17575 [Ohtaekwangia sp.]